MAAITTLRTTLATALTNNGVWSTFAFPPATLLANSVVVTPSDPYIEPNNNSQTGIAPLANFKIGIPFNQKISLVNLFAANGIQHGDLPRKILAEVKAEIQSLAINKDKLFRLIKSQ